MGSCSRKDEEVFDRDRVHSPVNDQDAVVPGRGGTPPQYDPGSDGWETEKWSADISAQLKGVFKLLLEGGDWKMALASACAADFKGVRMSLTNRPVSALRKESVTIEKPGGVIEFPVFSQAFTEIIDRVGLAQGMQRAKAKVIGIGMEDDGRISCEILFHLAGHQGGKVRDLTGEWRSLWVLQAGIPKLLSIEGEAYLTTSSMGRFNDVTEAALGSTPSFAAQFYRGQDHWTGQIEMLTGIDIGGWQGLALADVNGDGRDDIYVAQPGGLPNRLYVQQQDGKFTDRSATAGVDFLESSHGNLLVDLDNDGDQDLIVGLSDGIVLMENDGKGNFQTRQTKILPAAIPYSIAAADHDRDGDLDFFVCCYNRRAGVNRHHVFARPVPYHDANNGGRNAMFRNDGSWRFSNITRRAGLDANNRRFSYAACWEDYDNDGDLDLYVANDFGRNNLYKNVTSDDGLPRFEDVAETVGVLDIAPGMSACWGDCNNDGNPDLYVGNMFSAAGHRITSQGRFHEGADPGTREKYRRHARGNSLFMNDGGGRFTDESTRAGVSIGRWAWASKFADLDGDGWEDIVVANGFVTQQDSGDL
ncbi:MAG: VCBS repeat-containing protein [Verrucomicrobiaceae bacterium]|nr:VCBS repeat-containing protein [Verrucomicrobiaceae bacterium]